MLKALSALWLIWGMNWVVMKVANSYFPPVTFVTYRFALGAAIMLAMLVHLRKALPRAELVPWIIVTGVLQYVVNNITAQVGLRTLSTGFAAVLNYTTPLWMTLLARAFLGEALTRRKLVGLALSLSGLVVLMGVEPTDNFGVIALVLSGAAAWAMAGIIFKLKLSRADTLSIAAWQMIAGALALAAFNGLTEQGAVDWTPTAVLCLLYNGVLASAVAFVLWNRILTRMEASSASTATLVAPVVGATGGIIFLDEPLTVSIAIGIVMILSGIYIVTRAPTSK